MRITVALLLCAALAACNDVRDFGGSWRGPRVGDAPALQVGVAADATAQLAIDTIDTHGLAGTLTIDGLADGAAVTSLPGAEADALASMTFAGSPLRVYVAFAEASDGGGPLTVLIAIFDGDRVEVRALRGDPSPVYAVFVLKPL